MITSPQNEKLKLIRKLAERKHREREGLFATEGEDLLAAGLAAGREPVFALVAAGSGLDGEEVEPRAAGRGLDLGLRHAGDRRLGPGLGRASPSPPAPTCTASATRATWAP